MGGGDPDFSRLREHLAESRAAGLSFEQAWARAAAEGVLPPRGGSSKSGRVDMRGLVESTRPAWERSYDRLPPGPRERGVARLAGMLTDEPGAPEGNRHSVLS